MLLLTGHLFQVALKILFNSFFLAACWCMHLLDKTRCALHQHGRSSLQILSTWDV